MCNVAFYTSQLLHARGEADILVGVTARGPATVLVPANIYKPPIFRIRAEAATTTDPAVRAGLG